MTHVVRVLVVDDSALVRQIISQGLNADSGIEVVATAPDPYVARDKIMSLNPEVMTLDVEMPRMDGVEFLRKLMPQHPLPVVMVSSLTERGQQITLDALAAGAVDFVSKPRSNVARGLSGMMVELATKIKIAATANLSAWKNRPTHPPTKVAATTVKPLAESTDKVIAIGASTGGTEAIMKVLSVLPANCPGGVVVQHMPPGFTKMFSGRLDSQCAVAVKEAENDDRVMTGRFLIAPGGQHLQVIRSGGIYRVRVGAGELVCGHCPSVDVMMRSVATAAGANAIGVMLTGMGRDGAEAMKVMRDAGARCLAQDEATSVVFGMPKEAYASGGAEILVPLENVAGKVLSWLI